MTQHSDAEYLGVDVCGPSDGDITLRTVRIVKARKAHKCFGAIMDRPEHLIQPGERYRHEKALVDSDFWGVYRTCLPCLDKALDEPEED